MPNPALKKNKERILLLVVPQTFVYVCVSDLEAGLLGGQVGASSDSAQLYRGHGAADVEVLPCWS